MTRPASCGRSYAHAYHAESDVTPSVFGTFDVGLPLPFDHSSVWLRTGAGVASGDVEDPLANAYFGGFGNNYVDNGEAQRYREIAQHAGIRDRRAERQFLRQRHARVEPAADRASKRSGSPGFYGSWIASGPLRHGARDRTRTRRGTRSKRYNVGVQFDLQLQVLQPPADDVVPRLRQGLRGRRPGRGRVHAVAQGALRRIRTARGRRA